MEELVETLTPTVQLTGALQATVQLTGTLIQGTGEIEYATEQDIIDIFKEAQSWINL